MFLSRTHEIRNRLIVTLPPLLSRVAEAQSQTGAETMSEMSQPILEQEAEKVDVLKMTSSQLSDARIARHCTRQGLIYFAKTSDGAFIKFGFTTNIKRRIHGWSSYKKELGVSLVLIGSVPGFSGAEVIIRHKYRNYLVHTSHFGHLGYIRFDWLHSCPEIHDYIASILELGRAPKPNPRLLNRIRFSIARLNRGTHDKLSVDLTPRWCTDLTISRRRPNAERIGL